MENKNYQFNKEVNIVICGEAGQGIKTIEQLLVNILKRSGLNIFSTKEVMSRIRGGSNSTSIRVSEKNVKAMINNIDILISLDIKAIKHLESRIQDNTVIISDKELLNYEIEFIDVPIIRIAKELGNKVYTNIVACGIIFALFDENENVLKEYLKYKFKSKGKDVIEKNIQAAEQGFNLGKEIYNSGKVRINIKADPKVKDQYFYNGNDAIGYGALAGGCNFISSYPMSPSTGVLTFLSEKSKDMGIVVEQAEDEICAINMGLGAWYAGARALVTTSGGGFALMGEGISLCGIIETPVIIHLAQRPGPATGLPTRTEQGDLELAVYSGHGEFTRLVLALTDIESAVKITADAFNLADKYQIPVIILTDQYYLESYYNFRNVNLNINIDKYIVKTEKNYKRYKLTDNGISPRGIPGYGSGLVMVDSDEHDEYGRITEDGDIRNSMVEKRLKKKKLLEENMIAPVFSGENDYEILVIGWGSTYNCISEAVAEIRNKRIAHLHFIQVHPLNESIGDYLRKAKKLIIIENNATAQFAKLLLLKTGIDIKNRILKYDGMHFYVDELVKKINEQIGE
jgi:2-oxoglutarate ferredoxin oxidoreductase subunit alpha